MTFPNPNAKHRFMATIFAAATMLALMTAAAVPARAAEQHQYSDAMVALAATAFYGKEMNKQDKERAFRDAYMPRRHDRRETVLPARCAVELRGYSQRETVYPARCLRQSGIDRRLPQHCEVVLRGRGHGRIAYEQNCLLQSGFREQGRRRH